MIYLYITLSVLLGVGVFIGVRSYMKKQEEKKDKKAKKLEFEIGPITQK